MLRAVVHSWAHGRRAAQVLAWAALSWAGVAQGSQPTTTQTPLSWVWNSSGGGSVVPGSPAGAAPMPPRFAASYVVPPGAAPGTVSHTRVFDAPSPTRSGTVGVTVRRPVTAAAVGKAVAKSLPVVGTVAAIAELLQSSGVSQGPGGTVLFDPGAGPLPGQAWTSCNTTACATGPDAGWQGSPVAAYDRDADIACQQWRQQSAPPSIFRCTGTSSCAVRPQGWVADCFGRVREQVLNGQVISASGIAGSYFRNDAVGVPNPVRCAEGTAVAPWDGARCTTPTAQHEPVQAEDARVSDRLAPAVIASGAGTVARELERAQVPIEVGAPQFEVPTVKGDRRVESTPAGTTVTDVEFVPEVREDGWDWQTRETVRFYPPGTAVPPRDAPDQPPPVSETLQPIDIETCGLPGAPPCKIDESGTVQGSQLEQAFDLAGVQGVLDDVLECIQSPSTCFPPLPITAASFAFSMPSGCSVIAVPAFADFFPGGIDLCVFQPVFHDLMSVVWVMGGLLGAFGLFWRKTLAG